MTARATFNGSNVHVESVDLQLVAGRVTGSGNYNTDSQDFTFNGKAENVQLARLAALANRRGLQSITAWRVLALTLRQFFAQRLFGLARDCRRRSQRRSHQRTRRRHCRSARPYREPATQSHAFDGSVWRIANRCRAGQPGESLATCNHQREFTNADLTKLFAIALPGAGVTVSGRANGTIKVSGNLVDEDDNFSLAGLSGTATFSELSFRVEDIQLAATTPLTVHFKPNEIAFDATRFTGPGTNIVLDGTLATGAGGRKTCTSTAISTCACSMVFRPTSSRPALRKSRCASAAVSKIRV
jgi:hypothetical protein